MRRALTGGVGIVLTLLAATGRADDEVVWRAVPGAPPVAVESPASRPVQAIVFSESPTVQADAPPPRMLDLPRKEKENPIPGPGCWGTGTASHLAGPVPTYNLVAEHGLGEEAPPVDVGKRLWLRAEFLMWWMRPQNAPPLVSTVFPNLVPGPLTFTPGAIGTPGQLTLLGDGPVGGSFMLGGRFTAGLWLNDCQTCAVEGRYFFLGPRSDQFRLDSSPGTPIIARPIFSPNLFDGVPIGETAQIVAIPPGFTLPGGGAAPATNGSIIVDTSSYLWGAEVNAREALWVCGGCDFSRRIDLFAGFRYLDLKETLRIEEDILLLTPDVNGRPTGSRINVVDFFGTHDQFYGGQLGISGEVRRGRWFAEARAQVALGVTHQTLTIDGFQLFTPPGGGTVFDNRGGLLALRGANIGHFERDRFSVVPEVNLNVGYQLTPALRAFAGYSFLYWNNVIRPGTEIDRVVDVTRVPNFVPPGLNIAPLNPPRPAVQFRQTDFWAQGLNVGMELKW
jgi:hypothetical protein